MLVLIIIMTSFVYLSYTSKNIIDNLIYNFVILSVLDTSNVDKLRERHGPIKDGTHSLTVLGNI